MVTDVKEKTALATSVGADERQSIQTLSVCSISASEPEIKGEIENPPEDFEELCRQLRRFNDPAYLHTVSMNELYETVYRSRPPVIDGLLYSGIYLFAGAPKVGKSFFMAQLAYHISTGQKLWDYDVRQGTVLYVPFLIFVAGKNSVDFTKGQTQYAKIKEDALDSIP